MNKVPSVSYEQDKLIKDFVKSRYRTTSKEDQIRALAGYSSGRLTADRHHNKINERIKNAQTNPSMLKNADMLRSERFRTTVRDPPFAYDCMAPGDVGTKS